MDPGSETARDAGGGAFLKVVQVRHFLVLAMLAGSLLLSTVVLAEPGSVESIQVLGLGRMSEEAFLHAFGLKVGDRYDPERIRSGVKELWRLHLFEDLTVEAEAAPGGGKALVIKVKERPAISSITYDDNKVVTRTQIEDRYKERGIKLEPGRPLDMGTVFFAESAIRDLLAEKGFLDSTVKADVRRVTETTRGVHFTIEQGGKTRIQKIDFVGNELFADKKLKRQLKLTQERKFYWPWSKKNLYHPLKWDQDVAGVRELYQNHGYLDIEVRPPVVEVRRAKEPVAPAEAETKDKKAGKRWVFLSVPVSEGPQYRLGEIRFTGNEKISSPALRTLIPLQQGAVLNNGLLDFGVDRMTRMYEDRGHLYASVVRRLERRKDEHVADVDVSISEDQPYYIGRIDFLGHSKTRDGVLRRELQLREGDLFNRSLLEQSRLKINQLGYFQVPEQPVIEPIEGEQRVRVSFAGEEQGRNEIQIGGGYSGLEGAFFNGVYSTRNFLGRGQILSVALQIGGRSDRYQISFREPWFLNRPYLFGVSLFRRDTNYGATLSSTSDGFGVVFGKRLTRDSQLEVGYDFQSVTSTSFAFGSGLVLATDKVSSVTPVFSHNTVNNPYRPTRGRSVNLVFKVAGGALGGDASFLKPVGTFTEYRKSFTRRAYFGFHAELGLLREFAGGSERSSATVEGVPRFERFWLGGDTLGPRVFETRTITPRRYVRVENGVVTDVTGDIRDVSGEGWVLTPFGTPALVEVGGDRMYLLQSEFVMPLNEQAEFAVFFDLGDSLFEDTSFGFDTVRASTGVELRFHLPIFPVPLRLIYGVPVRRISGDATSNFTFSIGRSF
jgi:outer membrane protein insertion porin family